MLSEEDLECDETINLPQIVEGKDAQQKNLSTINEDVSQMSVTQMSIRRATSIVPPYLPKIQDKKYTLVLDLDETLIHYVEESQCNCHMQSHECVNNCN
jgi:hypothetical protein